MHGRAVFQHHYSKPPVSRLWYQAPAPDSAKFDTYRFADYKDKVIDLLARVTTVSVETQRIVEAMKQAPH